MISFSQDGDRVLILLLVIYSLIMLSISVDIGLVQSLDTSYVCFVIFSLDDLMDV
jgi:hypothetical protein